MTVERRQESKPTVKIVLGDCRKPIDFGLRGEEDLSSQEVTSAERHFNGARAFQAAERAYNGGASVVDRAERK